MPPAAPSRFPNPIRRNPSPRESPNSSPPTPSPWAEIDFDRLRALGLADQLTNSGLPFADSIPGAAQLVAAWDGASLLAIARGRFATAPAGAQLIPPDLAVFGSAPPSHPPARSELLDRAQALAAGTALWSITPGSAIPELPGNAANVTRLLNNATWVTLTLRAAPSLQLDIAAECPTGDEARRVEETARAFFALAASAEARQPATADVLHAIHIERTGSIARLHLTTRPESLAILRKLLH